MVTARARSMMRILTLALLALLVAPLALQAVAAQGSPLSNFGEPFQMALDWIIGIFKLDWLDNNAEAYGAIVRFCLWLITFAIVYEILSKFQYFSGKTSKIIGLCFATIAAVFIPVNMLLTIGGIWAAFMVMLFTGAIVFVGWKLSQWAKNQGGEGTPGAKWLFAVIMLVLIYIVYILQFALTQEREFDFMFLGFNVFNFYGWIMMVFLVWMLISGTLFAGSVAVAAKALDSLESNRAERKKGEEAKGQEDQGAQKALEADRSMQDIQKAEDIAKQIIRVEEAMNQEMLKIDSDAMGVLQRLAGLLETLAVLAQQLSQLGTPDVREKYEKYVVAALQAADELLDALSKEDKLAKQQAARIREKIDMVRVERRKKLRDVQNRLGRATASITRAERAEKGSKYKTLKDNSQLANKYRANAEGLKANLERIMKYLERIELAEDKVIDDATKSIHEEVGRVKDVKKILEELKEKPEPKRIAELKGKLVEVQQFIQARITAYQELLRREQEEGEIHKQEKTYLDSLTIIIKNVEILLQRMEKATNPQKEGKTQG